MLVWQPSFTTGLLKAGIVAACLLSGVACLPTDSGKRVTVTDIKNCPSLPPRAQPPKTVHDLRPDDIKVIMGLGDSVMAGFGIRAKTLLQGFNHTTPLEEYRGANFATGGDPDVTSVATMLGKYQPNLQGVSKGNHLFEVCYGPICPSGYYPDVDGLNGAQSGAMAMNIEKQVNYIVDQLNSSTKIDVKNDWKLATVWFGNNDLCLGCTNITQHLLFAPDKFEQNIRAGLESLRAQVPRVFVNLMSNLHISQMFQANQGKPYCETIRKVGLSVECSCAFAPGDLGEWTRSQMDLLTTEYNKRLVNISNDYKKAAHPDFVVAYDPGLENINLKDLTMGYLSGIDCFHPSLISHERFAMAVWNNMYLPAAKKSNAYSFSDDGIINCPSSQDRIQN